VPKKSGRSRHSTNSGSSCGPLAIQDRYWTTERRRHGLQSSSSCALCNQLPESVDHLLISCVISREVWFKCLCRSSWQQLAPSVDDELTNWWLRCRKQVPKARRKAFDSLCALVARSIQLHRNSVVFRSTQVGVSAHI
jgi:hypothetical protein